MKSLTILAALLPLAGLATAQAQAATDPLTVLLTPEGGASFLPGATVVFDATFTNLTGTAYSIDNATFDAADPLTAGLLFPLFTGPYTVGTGISTLSDAFELTADSSLPPQALIQGDVSFSGAPQTGGPDVEAASAPVQFRDVPAAAVPEPPARALVLLGLAPAVVVGYRRRHAGRAL